MIDPKDQKLLRSSSVFKALDDHAFNAVLKTLTVCVFDVGEVILEQDSLGEGMYIIKSGAVSLRALLPGNEHVEFCKLSKGEAFGQSSLIAGEGRTACVVTLKKTTCYVFSRNYLHMFYYADPKIVYELYQAVIADVCRRILEVYESLLGKLDDFSGSYVPFVESSVSEDMRLVALSFDDSPYDIAYLKQLPLFETFSDDDVELMLSYMEFVRAPRGYQLCERGSHSCAAFLIIQGAVQNLIQDGSVVSKLGLLGPGHLVGEVCLIGECGDLADAYVREAAYLLKMSQAKMDVLKQEHIELWYQFHRVLSALLVDVLRSADRQLIRLKSNQYFVGGQ